MESNLRTNSTTLTINRSGSRRWDAYKTASVRTPEVVEFLCNYWREEDGTDTLDEQGDTVLHFLAIYGNVEAFEQLIKRNLLSGDQLKDQVNASGDIALHEAARFGQKEVAEVMLKREKNMVSVQNKSDETPLYVAAANGKKEVFTLLTEYLSDCMTTRDDGCTILHAAVMGEFYYTGISTERIGKVPDPLMLATKHGIDELAIEILDRYPEAANSLDEKGRNILHIAVEKKCRILYEHFRKTVVHKERMMTAIDYEGNTVLHCAASVGDVPNLRPGAMEHMKWDVLWFEDDGHPVLLDNSKRALRLFLFYIGASLFAALFALATLLSIQLSPFHVDDFYFALPMKWLISSTAMFYSTTFTIMACLQTLILEDAMQNLYYVAMFATVIMLCLVYIDSIYICFRHMVKVIQYSFTYTSQQM
ncbi:hypothetical protein RJ639_044977 [Escallonia herrerae]|uniref:PGG domain-containing protein n=1 Tax=Escallonia herrerae TaxID=1293975 RepID=A0AA89B7X5_9ASTE|nr:hypothetical protein RJ639_044977 [Escallonia herrerae]